MLLDLAKKYPITDILDRIGCKKGRSIGSRIFYSSPFSSDSDPSFCVFTENNTFKDFSNGDQGDSIDLLMKVESIDFMEAAQKLSGIISLDQIESNFRVTKLRKKDKPPFCPDMYITYDASHVADITKYAIGRGIKTGYLPAVVKDFSSGEEVDMPSMMFVHEFNGVKTGAKFRFINPIKSRFTARGNLSSYVLENKLGDEYKYLYICESETSANSLWEMMVKHLVSGVVISMGAVSSKVRIPSKYKDIKNKYIIIDYDGSEDKYKERINFHGDIAEPIKLELPKGEDLNSLYSKGRIEEYKNLIFSEVEKVKNE